MTHLKVFFRKLSDVSYTLAQVFTCESQLSDVELEPWGGC